MIEHILTSSILILAVILIRAVFQKRISKWVCYAIWLLVAIKLMMPLPNVTNRLNVMNILSPYVLEYEERAAFLNNDEENVTKSPNVANTEKGRQEVQSTGHDIEPVEHWTGAQPLDFMSGMLGEPETAPEITVGTDWASSSLWSAPSYPAKKSDEKDERASEGKKERAGHTSTIQNQKWNIALVLKGIWILGSIVMGSVMLTSNLVFQRKLFWKRQTLETSDIGKGFVATKLPVYRTEEVETPCLFGLWHPAIYLTDEILDKDEKTIEMIVMHELVHYRHLDHIWSFIRCLLLMVYWWNPLVWIAAGLSAVDSELACDEGVIAKLGEENRGVYGESLIAVGTDNRKSAKWLVCGAGLAGRKGELKTRIKHLVGNRKQSMAALTLVCILLAGATGCTFGGSKGNDSAKVEGESTTAEHTGTDALEYKNGGRVLVKDIEIADGAEEWKTSIKTTFKPQEGNVNIGYSPIVFGDDRVRYFVPEENALQEKLLIALQNLTPQNEAEEGWYEQELGCSVYYNGVEWELFSGNCLVTTIENENGEPVQIVETPETNWNCVNVSEYVLNILQEQMHYEPVDVTAWTGITSATLDYMDNKTKKSASQTVTDKETLQMLEQWFSGAEVINGGTGCPFQNAMLTFTFENGEKASMMVADDSCSVFEVNGVCYDYRPAEYRGLGWDNALFKKLFDEIPFE